MGATENNAQKLHARQPLPFFAARVLRVRFSVKNKRESLVRACLKIKRVAEFFANSRECKSKNAGALSDSEAF
ncbi:hypothetical protein NSA36_01850 [Anaerotruncus colihominis]|nr:hypothetical protein [Anaerotruncus colihominis]